MRKSIKINESCDGRKLVSSLTSNVIESQGSVNVVDVVQKMEEIQIIFFWDSLAVVSEPD